LYSVFSATFEEFENHGHLKEYLFFEKYFLVSIDGTEYFRYSKIYCENCSETHHKNGKITYSHKALTPVLTFPGNPDVIPSEPESAGQTHLNAYAFSKIDRLTIKRLNISSPI